VYSLGGGRFPDAESDDCSLASVAVSDCGGGGSGGHGSVQVLQPTESAGASEAAPVRGQAPVPTRGRASRAQAGLDAILGLGDP
jgi:hypothetical protein